MNKYSDDRQIAEYFSQLRQAEHGQAPQFSSLVGNADKTRPGPGPLRPSRGLAVALVTLSILTVILLRPVGNDSATDGLNAPPFSADNMQLSSVDEMPTDFLLETPWPELASLESEAQLLDLPYEFLEEKPDEP